MTEKSLHHPNVQDHEENQKSIKIFVSVWSQNKTTAK